MADLDKLIEAIAKDDANVATSAVADALRIVADRMELLEIIMAPKNEDRMFRSPYQKLLINPGQEGEVYRQDVPTGFVGIITRIGNTWFPNTFYVRAIDNISLEPRIARSIAPIDEPMTTKTFVRESVIWRAQNNDGSPHTFEVVTDGFLVPEHIANRIASVEG